MEIVAEMETFDELNIEPCRTCGIYFTMDQAVIRPIFTKTGAGDIAYYPDILKQLSEWHIEATQDDGRPQYMCMGCIREFEKLFKFKQSCIETQEQFGEFETKRLHNGVVVKSEIAVQEQFCGFVYLDTDDEEGASEEDGSTRVCAAFDIPHVPIKEEHMARVPAPFQPLVAPEIEPKLLRAETNFQLVKHEQLAAVNNLNTSANNVHVIEDSNDNDDIVKFTYDDDTATAGAGSASTRVRCNLCAHESVTDKLHVEHMQRMHLLKDCECHICHKKFNNVPEARLKFHMNWHKLSKHLKCAICGFLCNSKDTLKEHKLAVHTRAPCEYCGKKIKIKLMNRHMNQHLQQMEMELAQVEQNLRRKENVMDVAANDFDLAIIQCAFCMSEFGNAQELQAHVLERHQATTVATTTVTMAEQQLETISTEDFVAATVNGNGNTDNAAYSMLDGASKEPNPPYSVLDGSASPTHSSSFESDNSSSQCHICHKTFNLKIKLNHHLRKHAVAHV